jgi:hypothetical protein
MTPETLTLLSDFGLLAGLVLAVWFLNKRNDKLTKTVTDRYLAEIADIKVRLDQCEEDRRALHQSVEQILRENGYKISQG